VSNKKKKQNLPWQEQLIYHPPQVADAVAPQSDLDDALSASNSSTCDAGDSGSAAELIITTVPSTTIRTTRSFTDLLNDMTTEDETKTPEQGRQSLIVGNVPRCTRRQLHDEFEDEPLLTSDADFAEDTSDLMGSGDEEDPSYDNEQDEDLFDTTMCEDIFAKGNDEEIFGSSNDDQIDATISSFDQSIKDIPLLSAKDLDEKRETGWTIAQGADPPKEAAKLYPHPAVQTDMAKACCKSPLALFFMFLPKTLWMHIAQETNRYRIQMMQEDATVILARQKAIKNRRPEYREKSTGTIMRELKAIKPVEPHELIKFIGLLCARTLTIPSVLQG
jgi:hypothetical protein